MSLKHKAFSGVLWSAIERFSVQGIQFILSFVIARQLLPSDYGLVAMLSFFMAIAQIFVTSGFSIALIQKQDRTNTDYSTVFYFNIVAGLLMYVLLVAISPLIANFYKQPILTQIIKWVALNLFISSFATVQSTILSINLDFKRQAIISFVTIIVSGTIAVYMAISGFGVWTLVVQGLLSNSINTVLLWFTSKWRPQLIFSISSFKELFSFGSRLLVGGLLNTIYTNLYTLVIGKFFPVYELGLFSRASSLTQYPSSNITTIIERVLYPVLCRFQNDNRTLIEKFYLSVRLSSFCVFPLMIGLAVLSEPLIQLVLTEKWLDAVPYVQILCIAFMWDPIMRMSWNLLNVKHRGDYSLKSELAKKIVAIIILIITLPFGICVMCWGLVLYSFLDMMIIMQFTRKLLPSANILILIKNIYPILIKTLIMGGVILIWVSCFDDAWIQLLGGFSLGLFCYVALSYFFDDKELVYIYNLIKGR